MSIVPPDIREREAEAVYTLASNYKEEVAQRLVGLDTRMCQLTGFEDALTKQLLEAFNQMRKAKLPSMAPLLPILFELKGKPYRLKDYFPFEPGFRTHVARETLFVTGRQLGKSSFLAANGITSSISIPHFTTLYVAPLFEMIRRFSQNYVRDLITNSPVQSLLINNETTKSVLQKSFINGSSMIFSYAFLDAERTRGISASKLVVDESVYALTPLMVTSAGATTVRFIVDVTPGDLVLSFDDRGKLTWARVLAKSYHGHRACFRITTRSGHVIVATSESWLATDRGWRRVSQIIEQITERVSPRRRDGSSEVAERSDETTSATYLGHDAGGRLHAEARGGSGVLQQSRLETSRVQLDKIPNIVRVCEHATRENEEQRLRNLLEYVQNDRCPGIRLLVSPDLPAWPQGNQRSMVERHRESRYLGDVGLVDRRRRQFDFGEDYDVTTYGRFLSEGSPRACALVAAARRSLHGVTGEEQENTWCDLLDHPLFGTGDDYARPECCTLHAASDVLQGCTVGAPRDGGLLVVRRNFQTGSHATTLSGHSSEESTTRGVVPTKALPETQKSGKVKAHHVEAGRARGKKRYKTSPILGESGEFETSRARSGEKVSTAPSAFVPAGQKTVLGQTTSHASREHLDVPAVRANGTVGSQRLEDTVLSDLPQGGHARDKNRVRTPEEGGEARGQQQENDTVPGLRETRPRKPRSRRKTGAMWASVQERTHSTASRDQNLDDLYLRADEIESIEFAGYHDVYDIEVEGTNTFIANGVATHNCQDLQADFIPIISETLSASPWGIKQWCGTPKSLDNTIQALLEDSSQAEWTIKCQTGGCGHWNVPSLDRDLWDMIGPFRADISEKAPGVVCAKCRKPLQPRTGRWIHAYREKRWTFAGYHIPQIIMPMHYADPEKWAILLNKQAGQGNMTRAQFLNEVCGVACDEGSKLVTVTDLRNAAVLPWNNKASEAVQHIKTYKYRILAVDWGGGGGRLRSGSASARKEEKRLRSSFTTLAVLGLDPKGVVDVLWGHRSLRTHEYQYEAQLCIETMAHFRCSHLVHDYGGAGAAREVFVVQAGWPWHNIMPMRYHGAASHNVINYHPGTEDHPRDWYSLDRSYTLSLTCEAIKHGLIRFFRDDYQSADNPGLLRDFLSLIEEKLDSRVGTDVFAIARNPNKPDDFAHAVNIGSCALWHMAKAWPDLAGAARMRLNPEVLRDLHPHGRVDWDDI